MVTVSKLITSNFIVKNNIIEAEIYEPIHELRIVNRFIVKIFDDGSQSPNSTNVTIQSIYPLNTLDQVTWTFREENSSGALLGTITGFHSDSLTPSGIFTSGTFANPTFNITYVGNVYVELLATDSASNVSTDNKTYIDYNV